jgi:flavorubredoxin
MITNTQTGTNVHEITEGIYRVNTPVDLPGGQSFSFNQYLVVDDEPLLFHTGPRQMFPLVRDAIASVMPVDKLRYIGFSHVEADECGGLNALLAVAPRAQPVCGKIAAMVSINDISDRPARDLADGEQLSLGRHTIKWLDAPHVPHGWECGFMMEERTGTFFCGDLYTQPGHGKQALTEADIIGPSEEFRRLMDYYAHAPQTAATLKRFAQLGPRTLACMHGSAWRGDGAALLGDLARSLDTPL